MASEGASLGRKEEEEEKAAEEELEDCDTEDQEIFLEGVVDGVDAGDAADDKDDSDNDEVDAVVFAAEKVEVAADEEATCGLF